MSNDHKKTASPQDSAGAVATILRPDPDADIHDEGPYMGREDWLRLQALPPGTKLYTAPQPADPAVEVAGEREAFELAAVDDNFGNLRALGEEAERRGIKDGDYIDFAARKAWEYFQAGAAWQRTQSAGVPEGWRYFVESCSLTRGCMVNGNRLSTAASRLLEQAPGSAEQSAQWPATPGLSASRSSEVDDLAMLTRRLVQQLRKAAPGNELSDQAMDYLARIGKQGNPLRDDNAAAPQPPQQPNPDVARLREALKSTRNSLFQACGLAIEPDVRSSLEQAVAKADAALAQTSGGETV